MIALVSIKTSLKFFCLEIFRVERLFHRAQIKYILLQVNTKQTYIHTFLNRQSQLLTLYSTDIILTHQQQTTFENIVEKGEIARYERFLLFTQSFLLNQIIVSPFVYIFDITSLFAAEFEKPKIGISGKGLTTL